MEALLLLFLLNYVKVWELQQLSEESSADGGSMHIERLHGKRHSVHQAEQQQH
jgi:hypothetical protein